MAPTHKNNIISHSEQSKTGARTESGTRSGFFISANEGHHP